MGGRQGHVPARVHSLRPYLSADGACSDLSLSPCFLPPQPDPAQPLDPQCRSVMLLGQNGLILGQRGNNHDWDDTSGSWSQVVMGSRADLTVGHFGAGAGAAGSTGEDREGVGRSPASSPL